MTFLGQESVESGSAVREVPADQRTLVLVGLMGAGKSSIGKTSQWPE
jgi:adenylylsulfate kinase-like enzyme